MQFRNYGIRIALELFFKKHTPEKGQAIELVIDRYIDDEQQEGELRDYLRGNKRLPGFTHIVQVDSRYSDPVQLSDKFGNLVKSRMHDGDGKANDLSFASILKLDDKP